jgi:hypothetical protein
VTDFWVSEDARTAWDTLYLGGELWPGVSNVEASSERGVNVAKPRDRSKDPTLTDNGYEPGSIKVTIKIWTEEQWEKLNEIVPRFSPRKSSTVRTPLELWHPATAILGIDTVFVKTIGVVPPQSNQILTFNMALMQWFPTTSRGRSVGRSDGGPLNQADFEVNEPNPANNL